MNLKKLNTLLTLSIILISTLVSMTSSTESLEIDIITVRGYLFIDDDGTVTPAPEGILVTLSFDSGDETDTTNENGYYQFDFLSDSYIGETGYYTVSYQGEDYIPLDEYDNTASIDIEAEYIYFLDIYIIFANKPPVANTGGPYTGKEGEPISFDGSNSFDPDGNIQTWSWDFDDGKTGNGETTEHSFENPGTYTITLTVTDNKGTTNSDTTSVDISSSGDDGGGSSPNDLDVDAGGFYYGIVDEELLMFGSVSGGLPPYDWNWDFGDGYTSNLQNPKHSYTVSGNYTMILTVTDSTGHIEKDVTWVIINIPPTNPNINGDTKTKMDVEVTYKITSTDDNDEVYYYIDWGDGTINDWDGPYNSNELIYCTHTWTERGLYTVKVKAKDIYGAESDWGTLVVLTSRMKISLFNIIIQRILERLPNLLPIIRLVFERLIKL